MTRVLGLDVGERRIGVAVSDALGLTAQRLTVVERGTRLDEDIRAVGALASERHADRIVVGLPLTLNGEVGHQAQQIMKFVEALRQAVPCPVETFDERLTTVQGERALLETDASRGKRKRLIDQVAAQLILQSYLDVQAKR